MRSMSARLTAVFVALVILVTGAVPAVAGYRCVLTGMRMEAQSACCRHREDPAPPTFKARCCESFSAPRLESRRTPPSPEAMMRGLALAAWVLLPPLAPLPPSPERAPASAARARPPGEQLHRFSSILRV
jgi:hypothetical protein